MSITTLSDLIRSGRVATIGVHAFVVYGAIYAHAWRSATRGDTRLRAYWTKGQLAAVLSGDRISELTGIARSTVVKSLELLERASWIRVDREKFGATNAFLLGTSTAGEEYLFATETPAPAYPPEIDEDPILPDRPAVMSYPRGVTAARSGGCPPRGQEPDRPAVTKSEESEYRIVSGQSSNRRSWAELGEEPCDYPSHNTGVKKSDEELALASFRAKKAQGREVDAEPIELLALWRQNFRYHFEGEDDSAWAAGATARKRLVREVSKFVVKCGGTARTLDYFRTLARWWKERREAEERFPAAAVPHLDEVLTGRGTYRLTFDEWWTGSMERWLSAKGRRR